MQAIFGCPILVEGRWEKEKAILIENERIVEVVSVDQIPENSTRTCLAGGRILPGFIDIQVNGGGGVLLNDMPNVETIEVIAKAHRAFGTTGMLPTLISDTPEIVAKAIGAVDQAINKGVPGVLGVHIEGPVLNRDKKGVHDAQRFRSLDDELIEVLSGLRLGKTLVTLAPEMVAPGDIEKLVRRGIIVFAGHTNADYHTIKRAVDEGLSGFTHLYNAMSPLQSRAPGVVGAALDLDETYAGIIVDGHHVDDASLRIAIKCKTIDNTILVTDAMPSVGAPEGFQSFDLFGEKVDASGPKLTVSAGNLAGSSLDMMSAVRNATERLGVSLEEASKMASMTPARAIGVERQLGQITKGRLANLVHIDAAGTVSKTWINGEACVHGDPPTAQMASQEVYT